MLARHCQKSAAAPSSLGRAVLPGPAAAEETLGCDSRSFSYRYCRADTDNRMELLRQRSLIDCREGRYWGHDRYGVWVDRGCPADFRVGRNDHHDRHKTVGSGVAIVGLATLTALVSSRKQQARQGRPGVRRYPPPWVISVVHSAFAAPATHERSNSGRAPGRSQAGPVGDVLAGRARKHRRPPGGRLGRPASSGARPGEGLTFTSAATTRRSGSRPGCSFCPAFAAPPQRRSVAGESTPSRRSASRIPPSRTWSYS
ncbi:DUF3011 domain-containing protein [Roseateles sp. LYH14W]|uniref:DUF3011 domain-containing protein n=1 Tax=Pelomonas parva TaxID=3299032 RepID=A0ABW7EVJ9_9BURK